MGYFDWQSKDYRKIPVREQVEVLSLVGDVAQQDGEPKVHAHAVVGRFDGLTRGGHLLEGHVRPTLEVMLVESPASAQRARSGIGAGLDPRVRENWEDMTMAERGKQSATPPVVVISGASAGVGRAAACAFAAEQGASIGLLARGRDGLEGETRRRGARRARARLAGGCERCRGRRSRGCRGRAGVWTDRRLGQQRDGVGFLPGEGDGSRRNTAG